jgi:pimeloyl-ACP methyl ester carboxylesterase
MFWIVAISCLITISFLVKFHRYLTFPNGRISRSYDRTSISSLTRMGPDQFIELSFGRVHYIYRPSSSKTSSTLNVFVHGFSLPMHVWQDVFLSLANDDQPCLVFDLYGRGWSDSPDLPMTVDLFVSQLTELLYALRLTDRNYNLFGMSMGGIIVQRFAQLYPSSVCKLILCCSAGLNVDQPSAILKWILSVPILGSILFKYVMQRSNSKAVRAQWAYPDREEYRQYQILHKQACQQHRGYLRALFSTVKHFDFQSIAKSTTLLKKIQQPVLILWGDHDTLIPVDNAYQYRLIYEQSSLTIIPGANHSLLMEHSNEAIQSIRTFLRDKSNGM